MLFAPVRDSVAGLIFGRSRCPYITTTRRPHRELTGCTLSKGQKGSTEPPRDLEPRRTSSDEAVTQERELPELLQDGVPMTVLVIENNAHSMRITI